MTKRNQINVSLDSEKDKDIIDFLEDAPKSWIIKQALRLYMNQEKVATVPTNTKAEAEEIGF